jgi:hypothetical protein
LPDPERVVVAVGNVSALSVPAFAVGGIFAGVFTLNEIL